MRIAVAVALIGLVLPAPSFAQSTADDAPAARATESRPARLGTRGGVYQHNLVETTPPRGTKVEKLEIDNRLGDVRIVGHDGRGVSIFAIKHAPDEDTLERLKVQFVHNPGAPVKIKTTMLLGKEGRPVPAGSARIDLIIRAPRGSLVKAESWNGRVEVTGFDNGAVLTTNDGDIDVRGVSGKVSAQSSQGKQSHAQIYGSVDVRSIGGNVNLKTVRGQRLDAVSQRGNIVGDNISVRAISIRSLRGNIDIRGEASAGGSYRIVSYHGDVTVRLTSSTPLKVTASTKGRLELPKRFRPVKTSSRAIAGYLGNGRSPANLDIRASTGNVKLIDFDL